VSNLTVDTVIPYLIARRLASVEAIVQGDLEIIDAGRRNQNLKVVRRRGASYLIKQPGEGERGTDATLRTEAAFYMYCHSDPSAAEIRGILPGFHSVDTEPCLLVTELSEGQPLWGHYGAAPATDLLLRSAGPLGEAIATIHRVFREPVSRTAQWMTSLHCAAPWIFQAHRPTPDVFANLSPANLEVLKLMQKDESIASGLDALRATWSADTLIHNDLKSDNIVVAILDDEQVRVRIVDWEMIQIGDAAWDVGTIFLDFLSYWLFSMPLSSDLTPEQMLEGTTWPLAKLHPAARSFWQVYAAAARLDRERAGTFLLRSLHYAAAQMAQRAYELCLTLSQPPNLAMAMLQLSSNIFASPHQASLHLLGIPAPWRKSIHVAAGA
jgi:hypothetical protein